MKWRRWGKRREWGNEDVVVRKCICRRSREEAIRLNGTEDQCQRRPPRHRRAVKWNIAACFQPGNGRSHAVLRQKGGRHTFRLVVWATRARPAIDAGSKVTKGTRSVQLVFRMICLFHVLHGFAFILCRDRSSRKEVRYAPLLKPYLFFGFQV